MRPGVTVAGACNGSASTGQTILTDPADVDISPNGTLFVADSNNQILAFPPHNRTATVLATFNSWPTFMFSDNRSSSIYVSLFDLHLVYIFPSNQTIPPDGMSVANCSMNRLEEPTGVVVDSEGNVYISSYACHWVMKWAPNATAGVLFAGSPLGIAGSDDQSLNLPYDMALDEINSVIYVADRDNHRIQKFPLNGSGIGITVAGGNGGGAAPNQLNRPTEIYLSKLDHSIYIADSFNNRIQKWPINASSSFGITVAGSPSGTPGYTEYLMSLTYAMAIDPDENYVYVSDSQNHRIQRYSLH